MKELLTIGELARQTGVNVKCLRYYSGLGILPPAYVDSSTGYRYYAPRQVMLVEAIRLCVEVGIPLSCMREYLSDDGSKVLFGKLLDDGCRVAEKKIRGIRRMLRFMREIQADMERVDSYAQASGCVEFFMPARHYWVLPFRGIHRGAEFNQALNELFLHLESLGIPMGIEAGLMLRCSPGGAKERYIVVEIHPGKKHLRRYATSVVSLPAARYRCCQTSGSRIDDAAAVFPGIKPEVLIEVEVSSDLGEATAVRYELRCLLPSCAS